MSGLAPRLINLQVFMSGLAPRPSNFNVFMRGLSPRLSNLLFLCLCLPLPVLFPLPVPLPLPLLLPLPLPLPLPLLLQLWLTPPLLVCSAFGAASSGGPAPAACSVSVQYGNCWILEARWEMRSENMQIT